MNRSPDSTPVRRAAAPSGTVTFAFTDIEGSTQRWERYPLAMPDAVRRHDALVRAAIVEHDGHVFKTIGGAFCVAFGRPAKALAALIAVQRSLAAADFTTIDGLRVRMAVHTGSTEERDGDYFGAVVNRVARLLAIAHGGQIIVSGITSELVRGELPAETVLRDLGEHRLKDLALPEHVYEVLAPGLATGFPALRSLDPRRHNLPAAPTSFIGREVEVAEISVLLAANRLVTVIGSGGVGKTRTSLQVAADVLETSGDGVWFIELAGLVSGAYIASTVALALGLSLPAEGDPVQSLVRELASKHALLIFDNCEHLLDPVAHVIAAILRASPRITVLASSRQTLGIAGEIAYRLPSLAVPGSAPGDPLRAADATRHAAIALFVERARAADNRFVVTDENAPTIADICRRLDGIPLALELAAARSKVLSPRQLRDRLDARFRMLTGGSRDALPRQQTLRALIDWSYDLLDERERTLFRRLGIFSGGFLLEGATAVGCGTELDAFEVLAVLSSLIDKSLVLTEPRGDALRYRLLESTREYAREKLTAAGEHGLSADRHVRYLRDTFAQARVHYERTAKRAELEDVMQRELEEVRGALDSARQTPSDLVVGELLAEIGICWQDLGLDSEGIRRVESSLSIVEPHETRLIARLSIVLAWLAANTYRTARAFEAAEVAVNAARRCGDPVTLAEALRAYALTAARLGRIDDAETALAEAQAIPGVSAAFRLALLQVRAALSMQRGDFAAAAFAFEHIRMQLRVTGNAARERVATLNLAGVEYARGETQRAIDLTSEVLPALRAHSDRTLLVETLIGLAGYLLSIDAFARAREAAREAVEDLRARDADSALAAMGVEHLAFTIAIDGDPARAAMLAAYVETAMQRHGHERDVVDLKTHDRLHAVLREKLTSAQLESARVAATDLTAETAITQALGR